VGVKGILVGGSWTLAASGESAASVWTPDVGRASSAPRSLQFGTVWINDHIPLARLG